MNVSLFKYARVRSVPLLALVLLVVACTEPSRPMPQQQEPMGEMEPEQEHGIEEPELELVPIQTLFTTPHPILGDIRIRQALAYCTDRRALIKGVYPFLSEEQQAALHMDTFVPPNHWAYATDGITKYAFDPAKGRQLLEQADWTHKSGQPVRVNAHNEPLALKFTTSDAMFRINYATVLQQQLLTNCGIQIVRTHAPGAWWFGSNSGLQRRDFELGAYAWVVGVDLDILSKYSCNHIPRPSNNWQGRNYMGWCNERAEESIMATYTTFDQAERVRQYAIVQQEFSKDMVSLPLFSRFEAVAASNNLSNFAPDVSDSSYVVNIHEWELKDGRDTVILGLTQEPTTLFAPVEDTYVAEIILDLLTSRAITAKDYAYQPAALKQLPTLENGDATLNVVEVTEGDMVWNTSGEAVQLAPNVEILHAHGDTIVYNGGTVEMNQLTVTFHLVDGLTWEDGQPVTKEDIELAHAITCNPESGAKIMTICNSQQDVVFADDTTFTMTFLPGALWPDYFTYVPGNYTGLSYAVGAYPSHQILSDGRKLADVPASEWVSLPEISEDPLSYGPYKLVEWQKGQRMVFEANPYYYQGAPKIQKVIVQFLDSTSTTVAQLLAGDIDVVGTETLGAGAELETVIKAGKAGKLQVFELIGSGWEHIDMNLFVKW